MKIVSINPSEANIFEEMKEIIAQKLEEWFGQGAVYDSNQPLLHQHQNSFMIRFGVKTLYGNEAVLVKIPSKPYFDSISDAIASDVSRERADEQYSATVAVWNAITEAGDTSCFAVPPPMYLKKWNALAMQEIKGKMLKSFLLQPTIFLGSTSAWNDLVEAVTHSSRWLRIVHSRVGNVKSEPFPIEEIQGLVDETLEKLELDSDGQVDVRPYREILQKHLDMVSQVSVPIGLLHDDYHYSNILITSDNRACALDYAFTNRGPIYADISTLLIDPETRLAQIFSFNKFLSREKLTQLHKKVLDNYFQGQPYHDQVLNLFCAIAVLYKWSVDERRFKSGGFKSYYSRILLPVIRRHFQNVFKSYLN
jgi:hypothetical protein